MTNLFSTYANLLVLWNQKFNLTSPTTLTNIKEKHFDDSLSYAEAIKFAGFDLSKPLKIADVGSGAGFPGIPLKIMYPHWNITLIEATAKKCLFLEEVIKELKLTGISVINNRAENISSYSSYSPSSSYDLVLARAVAPLEKLTTWCLPLLGPSGAIITQKGQHELSAPPLSSPRKACPRPDRGRGFSIEEFIRENKNLKIKTLNYGEKVFVIMLK